jgi:hypothetical protein
MIHWKNVLAYEMFKRLTRTLRKPHTPNTYIAHETCKTPHK